MTQRKFEKSRWFWKVMIVAIVLVLCAAVWHAMAGPPEAPSAALYAVAWNTTGITSDTNSTAYLTQNYAYHDLFCSVDMHTTGAVTITIQSSPAGTTYYDTYELGQIEYDMDVYTRVVSYGRYERLNLDVQGSNLITPVCRSVYFNNWSPANYCISGPR